MGSAIAPLLPVNFLETSRSRIGRLRLLVTVGWHVLQAFELANGKWPRVDRRSVVPQPRHLIFGPRFLVRLEVQADS